MFLTEDRRQEERYKIPIQLLVHPSSELELEAPLSVKTCTISQDGLSFILPKYLELKKGYKIELQLSSNVIIFAQIRILWIAAKGKHQILHGAKLSLPSENQSHILFDFFSGLEEKEKQHKSERREKIRRTNFNPSYSKKDNRHIDRRFINRFKSNPSQLNGSSRPIKFVGLRRVVITGIGIVAPNGIGEKDFEFALKNSSSGIDLVQKYRDLNFPCQSAAQISDSKIQKAIEYLSTLGGLPNLKKSKIFRRSDRPVLLAYLASLFAISDSKINFGRINKSNIGVSIGTILGGLGFAFKEHDIYYKKGIRKMDPYTVAAASPNSCSGELSSELNLRGPAVTFSQGCTSGASAISYAYHQIQRGRVPLMLAGGSDCPFQESTYAAFCRSGMLAPSFNGDVVSPKPFDKDRKGIILGEGAAVLVLEDLDHAIARSASIYAEILGESNNCDGFDMMKWRWHGSQTAQAIKMAMDESSLKPDDISAIFAQASGSYQGDEIELRAFAKAFGELFHQIPISNVKSLIGYTQGACAPIEMIAACIALKNQFIPGIPSFKSSSQKVNISNKPRQHNLNTCLINCIGFGGKNICLIIGKI